MVKRIAERQIQMTRRGSPVDILVTTLEEAEAMRHMGWTVTRTLCTYRNAPPSPQLELPL